MRIKIQSDTKSYPTTSSNSQSSGGHSSSRKNTVKVPISTENNSKQPQTGPLVANTETALPKDRSTQSDLTAIVTSEEFTPDKEYEPNSQLNEKVSQVIFYCTVHVQKVSSQIQQMFKFVNKITNLATF